MALTQQDLTDIRDVVLKALDIAVNPRLDGLEAGQAKHGMILNEHTQILNEHTEILTQHSRILQEHGLVLSQHGQRLERIELTMDHVSGELTALQADIKELYAAQ